MSPEELSKKKAGERAVEFIEQDMVIGLGTGSTVYWVIRKLEEKIKEGLRIQAIPTSKATEKLAVDAGIPLAAFEQVKELELTIDGADEVSEQFNMIKGGGGALLREKLVAVASKKLIIVVDSSKLVSNLGRFPLPIEIVPFSWEHTLERVRLLGCNATLRKKDNSTFITDNGNYILDCEFGEIQNPNEIHEKLKLIPGVVETGLFLKLADLIIVGHPDKYEVLKAERNPYSNVLDPSK